MAVNHGGFSAESPAEIEAANEKIQQPVGLATTDYRPELYETFGENSMGGAASTRLRELLMERRHFTRVQVRTLAVVKSQSTEISGEVENLSLKGIRLKTIQNFDLGRDVQVRISIKTGFCELWVEISGIVTRQEGNGMVIQFTQMSLDSYIHLRNVISNLLDDQSKVFDEFFLHMTNGSAKGQNAALHFQESFNEAVEQQMVPQC